MPPSYVKSCLIDKDKVNYEWSDWDPYELIEEADEKTVEVLNRLSLSGMLCFVTGCLEWVAYRCSYDDKYTLPFEYIEAFWVYLAGLEIALPDEVTDDDRWEGPLDGPVNLLIGKFYSTAQVFDFGGSATEAAFSAQVVKYILNDPEPFLQWESAVLSRLNKYASLKYRSDELHPIAKQIVDPGFEYNIEIERVLIRKNLLEINPHSNRFLSGLDKELKEYANHVVDT